MLNKILASFGIGAAKVDARLQNNRVRIGENLQGEIHIQGGSVEQSISQIYMYLFTYYYRKVNDNETLHKEVLASYRVSDSLVISPGEKKVLPFQLKVPYHTPISFNKQKVYLSTGLDIERAIDPKDLDPVIVEPDPLMEEIFRQVDALGFRHSFDSGKCKHASRIHRAVPFVQEFEFKPHGTFRDRLDEIELIFDVHESGIDILMQVDKKANNLMGLFAEALDLDEKYVRFTIHRNQPVPSNLIESKIRDALSI
jgi:sporulation-control protein